MNKKNLIKTINFLLIFLFAAAVYLSYLINRPYQIEYYTIILMAIALNFLAMIIFYVNVLQSKISNVKLISFKRFSTSTIVNDIIYLVIIYLFFTPAPFGDYLLYYFLLVIFILISFSITSLQIDVNKNNGQNS